MEALFFRAPAPPCCLNSGSPEDRIDPVSSGNCYPQDLKTWLDRLLTLFFLLFAAVLWWFSIRFINGLICSAISTLAQLFDDAPGANPEYAFLRSVSLQNSETGILTGTPDIPGIANSLLTGIILLSGALFCVRTLNRKKRVVEHIPAERDPENEMNFSNFGRNLRKDLIHDRIPDSVVALKKERGLYIFLRLTREYLNEFFPRKLSLSHNREESANWQDIAFRKDYKKFWTSIAGPNKGRVASLSLVACFL